MKRFVDYSDYEKDFQKKSKSLENANKDHKDAFLSNVSALNSSFLETIQAKLKQSPDTDLSPFISYTLSFKDYLDAYFLLPPASIYSFGSGDCGQLAHGVEEDSDMLVNVPRKIALLQDKKFTTVACGGLHSSAVDTEGQVYTWGCADDGSLGRKIEKDSEDDEEKKIDAEEQQELDREKDNKGKPEEIPTIVRFHTPQPIRVLKVACGDGQTLALTTQGDVYGWGAYKDKEGKKWFNPRSAASPLKSLKRQQNFPIKIEGLSNILDISCGSAVNLAYSSNGLLYTWGISECGELGRYAPPIKDASGEYDLQVISDYHLKPAVACIATAEDEAFVKAAIDDTKDPAYKPYSIADFDQSAKRKHVCGVKAFVCKGWHALVVLNNDDVYSVGLNNYGQTAHGDEKIRYFFTKSEYLSRQGIVQLAAGQHFTIALQDNGKVLSVGRADTGQLGNKDIQYKNPGDFVNKPVLVQFPENVKIASITCGDSHSLARTETTADGSNNLYSWGFGEMCALGTGNSSDAVTPALVDSKGRKFCHSVLAAGGQHSIVLLKEL